MASGSSRDVELRVTVDDDSGAGIRSVRQNVKRAADDTERDLLRLGKTVPGKIGAATTGGLAAVATKAGELAARIGIDSGTKIGDGIASSISGATPQVQGAVTALAVSAVATAAPLLAGGISAAVVGGAAGAGVVGGLVLVARDPRVKAAGVALGQSLLGTLESRADVFVAPVIQSIGRIQAEFTRTTPLIARGLAAAARYVEPLTQGFLRAGRAVTEGVVYAIQQAGPVIQVAAYGAERLGQAFRDVMINLGSVSDEGAIALKDIVDLISIAVRFTGALIRDFTYLYAQIRTLGGLIEADGAGLSGLGTDMRGVTVDTTVLTGAMTQLSTETAKVGDATNYLGKAQRDLGSAAVALDAAEATLAQTLANVNDVKERGNTVTASETLYLTQLLGQINATISAYDATTDSAEAVSQKTTELRDQFVATAIQLGYTRQQAEALARQYGLIPFEIETEVKTPGIGPAIQNARELERAVASIDRTVDIAIRVTGTSASRAAVAAGLAKQFSSDRYARHAESMAEFSHRLGFASPAPGGIERVPAGGAATPRQDVSVAADVSVLLDGRAIVPLATTVATRTVEAAQWRAARTPRSRTSGGTR